MVRVTLILKMERPDGWVREDEYTALQQTFPEAAQFLGGQLARWFAQNGGGKHADD